MRTAFTSISRGLLLIAIGVIFFLINYDILSWSFWFHVADLWPLILILAGIGLLFSRKIPLSAVLLVFLLSMVGYSMVMGDKPLPGQMNNFFHTGTTESKQINVPLPSDVKKASVDLQLGGAKVYVTALDSEVSEPQLMTGKYQGTKQNDAVGREVLDLSTQQSGDTLDVTLSSTAFGRNSDPIKWSDLELNLSRKVHYDLDVAAGAINGTMDLSNLLVDNFKISTGASNFEMEFGDTGITTRGKIDSGASKLTLVIPENVGITIRLNGVATSTNFMGSGLLLDDKSWVSPQYANALTKIDLDISMAAGSVRLERSKTSLQ
ncbi:hypothetical protein E4K67_13675 [Desulfosporosinus fructosivorans]|uniref:LiaI-LiaF-like transmembrane region domain-containing protein n=1 Tax=Desulfosporosinus fructosivorans TaxID=2018669 RepID=A0A4Z0R4M9_9FIRM|nr:DUF5668 domain-containing protein [Desulfosporosinus fructosivorans]TGE37758.1 hypothetical protein E4K67_13675 [Desulfosporosinus fructosivorans]